MGGGMRGASPRAVRSRRRGDAGLREQIDEDREE